MNYNSETINKLYYGDRLINISVTNGGGGGDVPSNLSEWTYDDNGILKSITFTAETIPTSAYSYSKLTDVTIGNNVSVLGDYSFASCSSLTSITLPNSVTSIGNNAFNGCTNLTSVTIGNSVTSIGNMAFRNCRSLTSVVIPNSVDFIDKNAFNNCFSLTSVTVLAETPPTLGSGVFSGTHNSLVIYVPAASVDAYKTATNWSSYASRIQAIA